MKNLFCLLLAAFSLTVSAQNDTISTKKELKSVVSADKVNVVYRGVSNPLSIAVTGAKSFTATAPGLQIKNGKYYLNPGSGNEVIIKVNIILNDNSEITEEHKFRIKSIGNVIGLINGSNCYDCIVEMAKEEFESAEISVKIDNFSIDVHFEIESFEIKLPNKKNIEVKGNKFDKISLVEINKLKKGTVFIIDRILIKSPESSGCGRTFPIKVMIVEREIPQNLYETKAFIKDSLRNLKIERKLKKKELRKK